MAPTKIRGQELANEFQAFSHQLWIEVIGNNEINQLQYYLCNMLVFDVIPLLIAQVLKSGEHDKAVELAKQISQLPDFISFTTVYPKSAPGYFEFIVMYAAVQKPEHHVDLLIQAQSAGEVKVGLLYNCLKGRLSISPWGVLQSTFDLVPPPNIAAWQKENQAQCAPIVAKYNRFNIYLGDPFVHAITAVEKAL